MNTLQKDQVLESGFKILEIVPLDELKSTGIYARHEKTGCEVFHVLNDDAENLFGFAFATSSNDSSGIAHVIEHSALCGSEKYPLKDAFTVLCQGSLQTYLNAWTFPDKTVYPASSTNEEDYFNLMSVYGDCVFHPLLDEWTFMQEGHHFEWADAKEKPKFARPGQSSIKISGVVYNEMKGAYSAIDEYAGQWAIRSVLPNTPYALDSGGDPECIPDLSYERFKQFHKERYAPANCKIFLAGNIPTEKQLSFLNEKFLSQLEAGKAAPPVGLEQKWDSSRTWTVAAPSGDSHEAGARKGEVFISWLCGANDAITPWLVLTEILLGHDGSPLARILTESGLGEDLSSVCGFETEMRQTVFSVGLRGVPRSGIEKRAANIEKLILDALTRLSEEGIPKQEIEAALLGLEFSSREIKRAHGPWSLIWLRRSLRCWIHGDTPWSALLFNPSFDKLKKDVAQDDRYFEKFIKTELLDNKHRALVIIKPEKDFLKKKEAALQARLKLFEKSLTKEEKQTYIEKNNELEKKQSAEDSPEALKTIPHLTRNSLLCAIEKVPRALEDVSGIPVLSHDIFTNGIAYCDLAFPVDLLSKDDYIWLPLFANCINGVGIVGMDWGEVSSLVARTMGDFWLRLHTGNTALGRDSRVITPSGTLDIAGRSWIMFKLKTLDEKLEPSLALAKRIICEADFGDAKRVRDLIVEMKNDADASIAPSGSTYAMLRSNSRRSHSGALNELWSGLSQIEFIHRVAQMSSAEITARLSAIRDTIIASGMFVNITREAGDKKETLDLIQKYASSFGPPKSRQGADTIPLLAPCEKNIELFSSASMQVGFAGMTLDAADYCTKESAAEIVLCHYLSTGPLWTNIRMKGGAYGAHAQTDPIEKFFSFNTYRDPNPVNSLKTIPSVLSDVAAGNIDDETMEKIIIGAYSREKQPRTAAENGFLDCMRFLCNIHDDDRLLNLKNILAVDQNDMTKVAKNLSEQMSNAAQTIIAGKHPAKKAAKELGVSAHSLPV
jgi:Zn-dependent M16 (insulinase) family peptidase